MRAGESELCIQAFDVADDSLVVEESTSFSVTVQNTGSETATGVVLLHTAGPDDETNAYQMNRLTLEPNASETLTRDINATTPGEHVLQISVIDPTTSERVAVSERRRVTIHAEPPARLGGPIDRTELAVVALVGSLAGIGLLGSRQLN